MENKKQYKPYFREEQRFSGSPIKWIFPLIFLVSVGPLAYGVYQQLVLGKPWGDHPSSNEGLILTFAFVFLLMAGLWIAFSVSKLEVIIDKEGIHYRFPLFIRKWRTIQKKHIARFEVRNYSPILEYGGWGYRHRPRLRARKRGVALNVSGKIGLQLYFTDGRKMLIGTRRPDAINRAMKKLTEENDREDD